MAETQRLEMIEPKQPAGMNYHRRPRRRPQLQIVPVVGNVVDAFSLKTFTSRSRLASPASEAQPAKSATAALLTKHFRSRRRMSRLFWCLGNVRDFPHALLG